MLPYYTLVEIMEPESAAVAPLEFEMVIVTNQPLEELQAKNEPYKYRLVCAKTGKTVPDQGPGRPDIVKIIREYTIHDRRLLFKKFIDQQQMELADARFVLNVY
jgi:hypothetical protein